VSEMETGPLARSIARIEQLRLKTLGEQCFHEGFGVKGLDIFVLFP